MTPIAKRVRRRLRRVKLSIRWSSILALARITSWPVVARSRVDLRPIDSTVATTPSTWITSPRRNGLSKITASAANRSEKIPCAARPIAMPPMPSPATRPVTLMPRLSSTTMKAIAKTMTLTIRRISVNAFASVSCSPAPARRWMKPRIASRAQIATCITAATVNRTAIMRSTGAGTRA